jgi:hypothetical protein
MIKTLSFISTAFLVSVASYGQVITYDLGFSANHANHVNVGALQGTIAVDTSHPDASLGGTFFQPIWLPDSGPWIHYASPPGTPPFTYAPIFFNQLFWEPSSPTGPANWNANLVPQFDDISFSGIYFDRIDAFTLRHIPSGDEFVLVSAIPIPEPEVYALVCGLGLVGFALYRSRAGRIHRLNPAV